jgi:hypothetical protein
MTIVDEFRQDECRILDRLVDGELSQSERRELLSALDDEPGAWRRAALAFLEAQSWRWQLAKMAGEPILTQAAAGANRAPRAWRRGRNRNTFWGACLAIAGSLLVAFGLGTQFPSTTGVQPLGTERQPAHVAVQEPNPAASADSTSVEASQPLWETLTLALGGDASDAHDKIQVRARDTDLDNADWLSASSTNVPAALVEQLEQEGWKVTRERHLVPVSLSDGRRMVVPVEQVDIRQPEATTF